MSMSSDTFAILTYDDGYTLRVEGTRPPDGEQKNCYVMLKTGGLSGWWSTPTPKISRTELGQGDGASNVQTQDIRYSARVVTLECAAVGSDHDNVMQSLDKVLRSAHHLVTLRVHDSDDTYVTGTASVTSSHVWSERYMEFTLTVECSQPERLSVQEQSLQLVCDGININGGGLSYGSGMCTYWEGEANNSVSVLATDTLTGTSGLHYPLTYRTFEYIDNPNTGLLQNHGTSRAYPVFKVFGPLEDGVRLEFPEAGLVLACNYPIGSMQTLILDSRTRTASINGRDISETLTARGFPTIPANGALPVVLVTTGKGWVDASVRDTYM